MSAAVVIVGGSVAGVRTARALREQGFAGKIRIIEAEDELPYDKPPLSKLPVDAQVHVPLLTAEDADRLGIELLLGHAVTSVDTEASALTLDHGEVIGFDTLVIATGARARPSPWALEGVHVLRGLTDARDIRERLSSGGRLMVVGAGFIGAEIASLARNNGMEVTLVDAAEVPMARVVGPELGRRFINLHHECGVTTRFGVTVDSMDHDGTEIRAVLSDGSELVADTVVVGIGAELNTEWLRASGLATDLGVLCDEFGRVVGRADIWAVGDVSAWRRPGARSHDRIEHWTNGVEQAVCVARNIAHPAEQVPHDGLAYVWSDQYSWRIHLFGSRPEQVRPVIVEESEPFRLAATWLDESGEVTGGATINWPRESVRLRKALAARIASRADRADHHGEVPA